MDKKRIIELYELLAANRATLEEHGEFNRLLNGANGEQTLRAFWDEHWEQIAKPDEDNVRIKNYESIFEYIIAQPQQQRIKRRLWLRYAAACLFCGLFIGAYFALHRSKPLQVAQIQKHILVPGGNKAILTLAGGKQIVLTGARNGKLAVQGTTNIQKTAEGEVAYQADKTSETAEVSFNTITTPRGGQYQVVLPDNSHVWLNAASSINFPTVFNGNSREVTITGEAYFEVAHNAARPFRVKSNGQTVEVLGTHFNVNAYADEPVMKTTLLEGSVRISTKGNTAMLKPGQQSNIGGNNAISVKNVDVDEVVAWKNGFFEFKDANIQSVMRQLSRWYDVEVEYASSIPPNEFSGEMERKLSGEQVLKLLSHTKVHFKINGKKIIVNPK